MIGLVRKGELKDAASQVSQEPGSKDLMFIDLSHIAREFKMLNFSEASVGYIEKLLPENDMESEELYPVAATSKTFMRPYLMPRKHLEYSIFWGATTLVGLYSIISYVVKK